MASRKSPLVQYTCELCKKPTAAPEGSVLHAFLLCEPCQAKRVAKGLSEQRKAASNG